MSYFNSITQNSGIDATNSNSGTLGAGLTWNAVGVGVSTIGFQGIQVTVQSTQNMTIIVEQGVTNATFQISDTYQYSTNLGNFNITVKVVAPFVRVSATNNGAITTTYLVNTILTPITEPLPRSLDSLGNLKSAIYNITDFHGSIAKISPLGQIDVNQPYTIVGTALDGANDANFWAVTNNGTGSASGIANSMAIVTSGTAANGWGRFSSVRVGRIVIDCVNKYRSNIRMTTLTQANTNRLWGAFTATAGSVGVLPISIDGYYFAFNGTDVLSVNTRNAGGTINSVASGSFNGTVNQFTMDTNIHTYEINYFPRKVQFLVDNVLIHSFIPTTTLLSSSNSLPIMAISTNSVGTTTASMEIWEIGILRLGRDLTAPNWKYIHGAVSAQVLKIGPGALHAVIDNGGTGTSITLYDAVTATNIIAIINPRATSMYTYNLDFYTGLTITTVGGTTDITVVYE